MHNMDQMFVIIILVWYVYTHSHTKAKPVIAVRWLRLLRQGDACAGTMRIGAGQILLETGLVPCRRAAHASRMMVWAPKVQPEPSTIK